MCRSPEIHFINILYKLLSPSFQLTVDGVDDLTVCRSSATLFDLRVVKLEELVDPVNQVRPGFAHSESWFGYDERSELVLRSGLTKELMTCRGVANLSLPVTVTFIG